MSSSSHFQVNVARLSYTPHPNPIPNSQFPVNFHFTNIHQILDVGGIRNRLHSYPSSSLQYPIHPRLLADPFLFSYHLFGFLCFNVDIPDEDRAFLAFMVAFSLPSQLPLSQVDAFVEIIQTEFRETNRMTIDGGFVLNGIDIEDLRPQYPYPVVDEVVIFDDAINGAIEKGRLEYVEESDEECAICFEKYRPGITAVKMASCTHIFHENCILKWFERKNTCPLCRTTAY